MKLTKLLYSSVDFWTGLEVIFILWNVLWARKIMTCRNQDIFLDKKGQECIQIMSVCSKDQKLKLHKTDHLFQGDTADIE
jgi:hypothetical protein